MTHNELEQLLLLIQVILLRLYQENGQDIVSVIINYKLIGYMK